MALTINCGDPFLMRQKRRNFGPAKILSPLVASTLRQERKAYFAGDGFDGGRDALIASYNIHKCIGVDGQFNPQRPMTVIKEIGADVIALQEVDRRFGNRASLLDLNALEQESGLVPIPLRGVRSNHGWRGNLVLVRDGTVTATRQLVLPGAEPRGALIVDLALPIGPLRIIAAHLGLLRRSRAHQVKALVSAAETKDGRPTLLMGDLNEWRVILDSTLIFMTCWRSDPAASSRRLQLFQDAFGLLFERRVDENFSGLGIKWRQTRDEDHVAGASAGRDRHTPFLENCCQTVRRG